MYELNFLSSAKKEFKKLDTPAQKIIKEKLLLLVTNPDALKNNIKAITITKLIVTNEITGNAKIYLVICFGLVFINFPF